LGDAYFVTSQKEEPDEAMTDTVQLEVTGVGKEFPTRGAPLTVLRDVTFSLSAGDNVAIVGPSGSGKSTLLHILGALEPPTSGQVRLGGENPFDLTEAEVAHFRNRRLGFIFQEHYLLPQLSVLENTLIPALAEASASNELVERARHLLDRVGLGDRLEHRPAELSGGERQRVAVARALLRGPELVLADEPTGSLDRTNAMSVTRLLLELQSQEHNMLVVVTHSAEVAEQMQRRFELDDGRLTETHASEKTASN
jgi:lipoprotein-releasing system ATP-binding protein